MLKHTLKACLNPFGIDIVKYPPLSPLARQLKALFLREKINLVLDVGACDGGYARFLRGSVGYKGRIVSFEPTKSTFKELCFRMRGDANWRGLNIGISDRVGGALLNTYGTKCDFNSILSLKSNDALCHGVDIKAHEVEQIEIRSIDAIWDDVTSGISDSLRVYLKTDTQGHDPSVIAGAKPRMSDIVAIQSEVPAIPIYDDMLPMHKTIKMLAELGYVPSGFHALFQHEDYYDGLSPEFDVVFSKLSRTI